MVKKRMPPQILINFLKTILQFNFSFYRHVKNANDNNVFDLGQNFTNTPGFGTFMCNLRSFLVKIENIKNLIIVYVG